jgi:hypothetical protein
MAFLMHNVRNVNPAVRRTCGIARFLVHAALALVVLTLAPVATAEIQIIASAPVDAETATLEQALRQELSSASVPVRALDARITVGVAAFVEALSEDDRRPLIATYLTSTEFETALGARARPAHVTAVFSNPDPLAQLTLARELLGQARLGVFNSPAVRSLVSRLAARGVSTIAAPPGQSIESLLRSTQPYEAILVLPDPAVLNRSNINHVVRTLYQQRKVLIGHSATLTRVGALGSVYASREAIARRAVLILEQFAASGTLPDSTFVTDVDVSLNERLARSLNIVLPDRAQILRAVRSSAAEGPP